MDQRKIVPRWTVLSALGIIILGLVALFNRNGYYFFTSESRHYFINPIAGHWLKTDYEAREIPSAKGQNSGLRTNKLIRLETVAYIPEETPQPKVIFHRNRELKNSNVVFYWTEGGKLKVMTLLSINSRGKKAGIVHFPLYTKLGEGVTIEDLYARQGGQAVIQAVAEKLEVPIDYYVGIDQKVFLGVSDIIGPVQIGREKILIAEAFAQTAADQRSDDQEVVRALLTKLIQPGTLMKVPKLVWIFTRQVETNLDADIILKLFGVAREMGSRNLRKTSIPGPIRIEDGRRYRHVPEEVWKNIIYQITN